MRTVLAPASVVLVAVLLGIVYRRTAHQPSVTLTDKPMRALVYRAYGLAEEVLKVESVPVPKMRPDEVVIRVEATSVNPSDVLIMAGYGKALFEARSSGEPGTLGAISKGQYVIGGADCAGVVHAVGADVSTFAKGDKVYSSPDKFNRPGWPPKMVP